MADWLTSEAASGGRPVQFPRAQAGPAAAGCSGPRPAGF